MENIFGMPITLIMFALLAGFGLCMALVAWIILRHRVVFRMGIRNIPRRPAQTTLIVIGLMLSTLIIAAALTTGDTLNYSIRAQVYDTFGSIDEIVVPTAAERGESARPQPGVTLPEYVAVDLRTELAGNPDIAGVAPVFSERVPVINPGTRASEPNMTIVGVPADGLEPFGMITDLDGKAIDLASLPEDGAVLGETAANKLGVNVGDILVTYVNNQPFEIIVSAIATDWLLTGMTAPGDPGGLTVPLSRAQAMFDRPSEISYVAVTNDGSVRGGVDLSENAVATMNLALEGTPYQAVAIKQEELRNAEESASMFMSMFLIFGLFSVSVGILLIFLIFVMLAAERKPEMGMARALGMKRRQLVQMFVAEGVAYDLVAAFVGALLGIVAAVLMVGAMTRMFGEFLEIQLAVTWTSLIIAYTVGVTITFVTILISSWRVSKLNIVHAIRNTPDPERGRAERRWLVVGISGLIFGASMVWIGATSGQHFPFGLGVSVIPFGLALALRRYGAPARPLYTLMAALVLGYWLMPQSWMQRILPDLSGDIEMFFISGIMLVAAATIIIIWNAELITGLISVLGQRFSRWLPPVKTAVAYPLASKGRTGMTIAMFSLVIFSLVMMASINTNILALMFGENAGGGWQVRVVDSPSNPIGDLAQTLDGHGMDVSSITATGIVRTVFPTRTEVRLGGDSAWGSYTVNGVDAEFIAASTIPLQVRAAGYADDAEVWSAIRDTPGLAIIDSWALPTSGIMAGGPATFQIPGIQQHARVMDPEEIEIRDPMSGNLRSVTIIGVIDSEVSTMFGIFTSEQTFAGIFAQPGMTTHTVQLREGIDATDAARKIESTLINYGVQAISVDEIIDEQTIASRGFLNLFQGFMGLGLIVGIAALGVIAFRSVVERRQQIGMLRAIGYSRRMVAASFVIESSMVTLLGVVSGVALGVLLSWNLITSDYFLGTGAEVSFLVPWTSIIIFVLLSLVASLVMAYIPARRAARVPIAEALRYE